MTPEFFEEFSPLWDQFERVLKESYIKRIPGRTFCPMSTQNSDGRSGVLVVTEIHGRHGLKRPFSKNSIMGWRGNFTIMTDWTHWPRTTSKEKPAALKHF